MDPTLILMFGLIAVMIFFMFRNGRKRQAAQQEMQSSLRPGAEVMLQSGIYGTVVSLDEEEDRVTVPSGTSTLVAHRNAVSQIVTPVDATDSEESNADLAPDDDPAFGERIAEERAAADAAESTEIVEESSVDSDSTDSNGDADQPNKA